MAPSLQDVDTPLGPARLTISSPPGSAIGRLVLGHGAGGGIAAGDLVATRAEAVELGWQVVLVEQPWRVAGRKVAPLPPKLDIGWAAVMQALDDLDHPDGPLVVGGRSAGARVACRSAAGSGAAGVLCLAFPLHPPGRPEKSRAQELLGPAHLPVLVVQGDRDPFGRPEEFEALPLPDRTTLVPVPGDHGLSRPAGTVGLVRDAVRGWLSGLA